LQKYWLYNFLRLGHSKLRDLTNLWSYKLRRHFGDVIKLRYVHPSDITIFFHFQAFF